MKPSSKAILIYHKKVLLLLRDNTSDIKEPGKWSLPGGGVEFGESHKEALLRELKEEINIVPKNARFLGSLNLFWLFRHAFYLIRLSDKEFNQIKLGNEGQAIRFFSVDELENINLTSSLSQYFKKYKKCLKRIVEQGKLVKPEQIGLKPHSKPVPKI